VKGFSSLKSASKEQNNDGKSEICALDRFFHKKYNQTTDVLNEVDFTDHQVREQIISVSHQAQMSFSEDVLLYWHMRRYTQPTLFEISQALLAVSASQVTLERAFCALSCVSTAWQNQLEDEKIDDLLVCKLNPEMFDQI
jgi:hAT family C-terminal dimerisation region